MPTSSHDALTAIVGPFTRKLALSLGLCLAVSPVTALAEGVPFGQPLIDPTDAVAYLAFGLGEGSEFTFPSGATASVTETGRELTSNDPYGWELHYRDGTGGSSIISIGKQSDCRYLLTIATYKLDRRLWANDPPDIIKAELDFKAVTGVRIDAGHSVLEGMTCTPVENGDDYCSTVREKGIISTGRQERANEVFQQFRKTICKP